ncbi:hypothetical protein PVK06_036361 [Gossypium arboreum]|uniref:DUF4283 domain-containing protein n=1 Tax=Gossypium arboreum TaxID=29729 RepID=A0ABR0NJV4_GOSAR|nr:hypothetical protein PVK06_036361 [Gossypium arboreum]
MKKKFEIQLAGQNLFLIMFDSEKDLETVMEGQPWLFRKNLVLFDQLTTSMERSQIQLNSSPYWIKIGPCLPEFDKKDLMHAIGATFGGILRSAINGEFCRLKVQLDVLKPLRRGIFVSTENQYDIEKISKLNFQEKGNSTIAQRSQDSAQLTGKEKAMMIHEEVIVRKEKENGEINNHVRILKPAKKPRWKRFEAVREIDSGNRYSILRKIKSGDVEIEDDGNEKSCDAEATRMKYDDQDSHNDRGTLFSAEILKQGAEGSRGGISMAWKVGITIRLNNFSKNHIGVLVKEDNFNQEGDLQGSMAALTLLIRMSRGIC